MNWFGPRYGCPYEADSEPVATPVGELCAWCNEAIEDHDPGTILPVLGVESGQAVYHYECHVRIIVGGVNHLLQRCTCCCGGTREPDDLDLLTRREAAIAASILWDGLQERLRP